MATANQRKTALKVKETLENHDAMDGKDILAFIGYSKGIQKNPKMVFESKGFKEAMEQLGFSITAADLTIAKILRTGKEENRIKSAQEIYKRLGAYDQQDSVKPSVVAVQVIINGGNNAQNRTDGEAVAGA